MKRTMAIALVIGSLGAISCSSSPSPAGACTAYSVPAGTDLTKPVSFANDVVPIFERSCSLSSSCHAGTNAANNNGVYLGELMMGAPDLATLHDGLLKTPGGVDVIDMPFVTPGDPTHSFLMHKMDADQCTLECQSSTCGASMPYTADTLPASTRDVVRSWITQGAKQN